MKNILKLKLYGYTVCGTDRRDGSSFEDHVVVSDLDGDDCNKRIGFISNAYNLRGFSVCVNNIISDREPGYNSKNGIAVDLDLHDLYLQKLKALKRSE